MSFDPTPNRYLFQLESRIKDILELEDKIDELRRFKMEQEKPLREKVVSGSYDLVQIMQAITAIADTILMTALKMAQTEVQKNMGVPFYRDKDANFVAAELAVIGMGKLGAQELHFSSDLDIIFIYNRNSQNTTGKTNQEIFAKIAQRVISYLTLYTRHQYAYKVDTELRPSGNAGALVTPFDAWTQHYKDHAALWEKQALLKSRLIYAGGNFKDDFVDLFKRLIFLQPFPPDMAEQIHHLRLRIEKELAKETSRRWHFKKGLGGIIDIEFAIQFMQLKMGKIFPHIVTPNTLLALEHIESRNLLPASSLQLFRSAYAFYRRIEFYLELKLNLKEGYVDLENEYLPDLASFCSFNDPKLFIEQYNDFRLRVRAEYLRVLKIKADE